MAPSGPGFIFWILVFALSKGKALKAAKVPAIKDPLYIYINVYISVKIVFI